MAEGVVTGLPELLVPPVIPLRKSSSPYAVAADLRSSGAPLERGSPRSLRSQPIELVPNKTVCAASAAFPRGNAYMACAELGTIFRDEDFVPLSPGRGRPAEAPWRLALVTVFQFAEGLSGRARCRLAAR